MMKKLPNVQKPWIEQWGYIYEQVLYNKLTENPSRIIQKTVSSATYIWPWLNNVLNIKHVRPMLDISC